MHWSRFAIHKHFTDCDNDIRLIDQMHRSRDCHSRSFTDCDNIWSVRLIKCIDRGLPFASILRIVMTSDHFDRSIETCHSQAFMDYDDIRSIWLINRMHWSRFAIHKHIYGLWWHIMDVVWSIYQSNAFDRGLAFTSILRIVLDPSIPWMMEMPKSCSICGRFLGVNSQTAQFDCFHRYICIPFTCIQKEIIVKISVNPLVIDAMAAPSPSSASSEPSEPYVPISSPFVSVFFLRF